MPVYKEGLEAVLYALSYQIASFSPQIVLLYSCQCPFDCILKEGDANVCTSGGDIKHFYQR